MKGSKETTEEKLIGALLRQTNPLQFWQRKMFYYVLH